MRYFELLFSAICAVAFRLVLSAAPANQHQVSSSPESNKLAGFDSVVSSGYELFAVFNSSSCIESLTYGPSQVTEGGSSDGYSAYLSTNTSKKDIPHRKWVQFIMAAGGRDMCSITYLFDTPRTLEDHFVAAVNSFVPVEFTLTCQGYDSSQVQTRSANWQFSPTAGNMTRKFAATESTVGFSDDSGVWGTVTISHTGVMKFWGVFNSDSTDSVSCPNVYIDGQLSEMYGATTFMYYVVESEEPTAMPTSSPSDDEDASWSTPMIAGVTIGCVGGVVCLLVLWYKWRYVREGGLLKETAREPGEYYCAWLAYG